MQDAASGSEDTFPLPKSEEQVPLRWHTAGIELHWAQGREQKPFYLSGSGKEMYKEKKKRRRRQNNKPIQIHWSWLSTFILWHPLGSRWLNGSLTSQEISTIPWASRATCCCWLLRQECPKWGSAATRDTLATSQGRGNMAVVAVPIQVAAPKKIKKIKK